MGPPGAVLVGECRGVAADGGCKVLKEEKIYEVAIPTEPPGREGGGLLRVPLSVPP